MEIIWAPWRSNYIKNYNKENKCIFCYYQDKKIIDLEPNVDNLILYKSTNCFVIMNKYPYINGHVMVVPYRHLDDILSLNDQEKIDIFNNIQFMVKCIKELYNPSGFNIGINLGNVAGAGIENHLHFHIVPRFNADHNFMTTISNTRVISFSLQETYNELYRLITKNKEGET